MRVISTIAELKAVIKAEKSQQKTIGFVPTMGYLHEGHRALLKKARQENQFVVLSVFVNPLQFGPNEDLETYPRDFEQDQKTAEEENVDIMFHPSVAEMYPNELSVSMKVRKRTDVLCGESRPGHFDGVAAVVTKLFHLVQPDRAYFGKKDAQQLAVIQGLVDDFNFPLEIVPVETVRESDGLAKSSRNVYLTEKERAEAPVLYSSLRMAADRIKAGEVNPERIVHSIMDRIQTETSGQIDYISILTYPGLEKMEVIKGNYIIALAVKFSKARLIDNIILIEE
ncbi:pantoate--beta-alanine ligase [Niallia endozanthoxylica]|uniref:Pantothenate synthetase n=1 Tax=Niallia endozanthoxylica TaxID=2036016 RepID=A0A5J5HYH3_9BACI|nr:pantoate--beta-alanine ligase [Niallia endozanthoxylica]KAA9026102.1 pantoate--beta-alanine ligase [Niallia endozanthoxylica]